MNTILRHSQKDHGWNNPLMNQRGSIPDVAPFLWVLVYGVMGYEVGSIFRQSDIGVIVAMIAAFLMAMRHENKETSMFLGLLSIGLLAPIYFFVPAPLRIWFLVSICLIVPVLAVYHIPAVQSGSAGKYTEYAANIVMTAIFIVSVLIIIAYFRGEKPHIIALAISFIVAPLTALSVVMSSIAWIIEKMSKKKG